MVESLEKTSFMSVIGRGVPRSVVIGSVVIGSVVIGSVQPAASDSNILLALSY